MGVCGQHHAPATLPLGLPQYPLYKTGGPQGQSGRVQKILPPPGFDPQTVQPIASCYTNWAIPVHVSANNTAVFLLFVKSLQFQEYEVTPNRICV